MQLSIFDENDTILLVGEGNFSFSVALCKHNLKIVFIATCYETEPINVTALGNIEYLKNNGIRVMLGVDATKLPEYDQLKTLRFTKILFNFPHVCSKMRIDKNRELLRKFFESAETMLVPNGKVVVALCNGQGGTNYDEPQRRWDDSWKIREMAAHGNFTLQDVEPYVPDNFVNYTTTGYRGIDKQFSIEKALVHVFVPFGTPVQAHFRPVRQNLPSTSNLSNLQWRDISPHQIKKGKLESPIFSLDITFIVLPDFNSNIFYTVLYNNAGNIIENVEFLRWYQFKDSQKITRTYRISYHSDTIPLYRRRAIEIHENIIPQILENNLNIKVHKSQ